MKSVQFFIVGLLVWGLFSFDSVWAGTTAWKSLTTQHTIIRYQSENVLVKFNKKIDYSYGGGFKSFFGNSSKKEFNSALQKKIDALFKRVQEILDMRKYMRKVKIEIYADKKKMQAAYSQKFKTQGHYRAWYRFDQNTIYLQVKDMHEGMLAHEMAHAIIDNFLKVRPPRASAEILARYVDTHLHD